MTVDTVRRRFTVDEYLHMAQVGILTTRDRVELLDGEIVEMTPIGLPHAACVSALVRVLMIGVGPRAIVWPQGPIHLSERSQPEPDVTLIRPRPVPYRDAAARLGRSCCSSRSRTPLSGATGGSSSPCTRVRGSPSTGSWMSRTA